MCGLRVAFCSVLLPLAGCHAVAGRQPAVVYDIPPTHDTSSIASMPGSLDYNQAIHLDAEDLAEGGIGAAYTALHVSLRRYLVAPASIMEDLNTTSGRYAVRFGNREFVVFDPQVPEAAERSWGLATYALFTIVNEQLAASEYRFYAINGGNDLHGLFLTPEEAEAARAALPRRADWPYLPTADGPWYGAFH